MRKVALLALLITGTAQAQTVKEGQWEYTNTMKIAGMPDMPAMPALPPGMTLPGGMSMSGGPGGMTMTLKQCITNSDLRPKMKDEGKYKCEKTKEKREGNRFEWAMHCTGKNTDFTSQGAGSYSADSMSSDMSSKGTMDGHPADMTMKTTGKYLGACPPQK